MEIVKVDFLKDTENKIVLSDQANIEKLLKYAIPIIKENEGWATEDLTEQSFLENPATFQIVIDASVENNVHILLNNGEPVGLLEFNKTTIYEPTKEHERLKLILDSGNFQDFNNGLAQKLDESILPDMKAFLLSRPIYDGVGVVLRADLQNKDTGYADALYKIVSDGIVFGMTSSPIVLRKRMKIFKNTLFFPTFDKFPNTVAEWAVCLYVYADITSHTEDAFKDLNFGAMFSQYFIESRGDKYIEIAKNMRANGKISETDVKRFEYVLSKKFCASAIVSWN